MAQSKNDKRRRYLVLCQGDIDRVLAAGSALLIAALFGAVQFFGPAAASRMQRDIVDFGHVPVFAILAIAMLYLLRVVGVASPRGGYARSAAVVAALSVASEALQLADPNRIASVADFLRNLAGGGIGLLLAAAWSRKTGRLQTPRSAAWPVAAAAMLLCVALAPTALTAVAYLHQRQSWPAIAGSNYLLERRFLVAYKSELVLPPLSSAWHGEAGGPGIRVRALAGESGGVLVQELARRLPADRRASTRLCIDATNPGHEPIRLSGAFGDQPLHFRSAAFGRFRLLLPPEQRATLCVHVTEPADHRPEMTGMASWRSIALLSDGGSGSREYILHRIWLR